MLTQHIHSSFSLRIGTQHMHSICLLRIGTENSLLGIDTEQIHSTYALNIALGFARLSITNGQQADTHHGAPAIGLAPVEEVARTHDPLKCDSCFSRTCNSGCQKTTLEAEPQA